MDEVTFDTTEYQFQGTPGPRVWHSPKGDGVGLYYFALVPDIEASLDDIVGLRTYYRRLGDESQLGMLEVERVDLEGIPSVQTLFKAVQQPTGRTYIGSLTLPFHDRSYVVKVQAAEHPPTGMRDTLVFQEQLQKGNVSLVGGVAKGWLLDPYEPGREGPMTRNRSELAAYDALFPDHPLSRVRETLRHIRATLRVSSALRSAPPFIYPSVSR